MAPLLRHLALAASLLALAWQASCLPHTLPVLVPVTKDLKTSLYTFPFTFGNNFVIDIAGPLVWSECKDGHVPAEFPCNSKTCELAKKYTVPGCHVAACGLDKAKDKTCTAYPYNPVTGAYAPGSLAHARFIANTTDGKHPVSMVAVKVVWACPEKKLLEKLLKELPGGTTGVAGLAGSDLALPAQVASSQNVSRKFLLCLSRGGVYGDGVAIFGGGPLYLTQVPTEEYTQKLDYTPLVTKADSPAYYVTVKSIALENSIVRLPLGCLAPGGAVLCTREPYTVLRPDVYRPFVDAFGKAMKTQKAGMVERVPAVSPFELCYNARKLGNSLSGYAVPSVTLTLDGGKKWTMTGTNTMVDMKPGVACLAFVEMKGVKAGDSKAPAVIVGGFQMENFVLQFDLEKKRLGFLRLPVYAKCGQFNFTKSGY